MPNDYITCSPSSCTTSGTIQSTAGILSIQTQQRHKEMEYTYAWSGLNFIFYCIGIAILVGMALFTFDMFMDWLRKWMDRAKENRENLISSIRNEPKKPVRRR